MGKRKSEKKIVKLGSPEFEKLQAEWYKKLRESGFEDIEWHSDRGLGSQNSNYLKSPSMRMAVSYDEIKVTYYNRCSEFLNSAHFTNRFDKMVWELHTEGRSIRFIKSKLLELGLKASFAWVHKTLQILKSRMEDYFKFPREPMSFRVLNCSVYKRAIVRVKNSGGTKTIFLGKKR